VIVRFGRWTAAELASAVGGVLEGPDRSLDRIGTDSREPLPGGLFVALRGTRFDGHDHLASAADGGAVAALVDHRALPDDAPATRIRVDDPLTALRFMGAHHRRRWGGRVVALTGSNGKTSTKEILSVLLGAAGPVGKTPGNQNNRIGAPMALLGLQDEPVAVLELGMNEPDEIRDLACMAEPDVAMILNIGPAHIGRLGSMEAIARAKGEIYEGAPGAVRVGLREDERVMGQLACFRGPAVTFGEHADADVRLVERVAWRDGGGQRVVLRQGMQTTTWELPLPGAHQARNLAAAWAACLALPPDVRPAPEAAAEALKGMTGLKGRGQTETIGDVVVVDESYNANRGSVVAALDAVAERAGSAGAPFGLALGAMNEIEGFEDREHRAVGEHAARLGARFMGAFGPPESRVEAAAQGARAGGIDGFWERDPDRFFEALKSRLAPRTWLLVKGSRSARTEQFIERLKEEAGSCST
jgi:UDP-N-acetylmuramoyl-tripeptide--D-alanyl-D-alanine ligase